MQRICARPYVGVRVYGARFSGTRVYGAYFYSALAQNVQVGDDIGKGRFFRTVRRKDHGFTLCRKIRHHVQHLHARRPVKPRGRFVEKVDFPLQNGNAGKGELSSFAARKRVYFPIGEQIEGKGAQVHGAPHLIAYGLNVCGAAL